MVTADFPLPGSAIKLPDNCSEGSEVEIVILGTGDIGSCSLARPKRYESGGSTDCINGRIGGPGGGVGGS